MLILPLRNVQQKMTSPLSEAETDSQSHEVDRLSVQARVAQVTNRHRRLILYQNPERKNYRRQNMDEGGHG